MFKYQGLLEICIWRYEGKLDQHTLYNVSNNYLYSKIFACDVL